MGPAILVSAAACGLGCALPVSIKESKKNAWSELLRLALVWVPLFDY